MDSQANPLRYMEVVAAVASLDVYTALLASGTLGEAGLRYVRGMLDPESTTGKLFREVPWQRDQVRLAVDAELARVRGIDPADLPGSLLSDLGAADSPADLL